MTLLERDDVEGGCIIVAAVAVGGSVFYFVRGTLCSSSRGCRLADGVQAVVANAPRVRRCAAWASVVAAIVHRTRFSELPDSLALGWGGANALLSAHMGAADAICEGVKGAVYGGAVGIAICMLGRFLDSVET